MNQKKVALMDWSFFGIGRAITDLLPRHGFRVFGTTP
jgi:hypothetical protein